jgi:hypothetical protein
MHMKGADCLVLVTKRGNARGAKGQITRVEIAGSTGNRRSPLVSTGGGSLHWVTRAG